MALMGRRDLTGRPDAKVRVSTLALPSTGGAGQAASHLIRNSRLAGRATHYEPTALGRRADNYHGLAIWEAGPAGAHQIGIVTNNLQRGAYLPVRVRRKAHHEK